MQPNLPDQVNNGVDSIKLVDYSPYRMLGRWGVWLF